MGTSVDEFVGLVREYVALIDGVASRKPDELLRRCARLLPLLYSKGLDLPDVVVTETSVDAPSPPSPLERIDRVLGKLAYCYGVWEPYELPEQTKPADLEHWLSDDLADVYCDLAEALTSFDAGRRDDAVWAWRWTMERHAGEHIAHAMPAIHAALFG